MEQSKLTNIYSNSKPDKTFLVMVLVLASFNFKTKEIKMTNEEFLKIIEDRHRQCLETLKIKATTYASSTDRLSDFKSTGAMNDETPQEALWGMVSKHIIATKDIIKGDELPSEKWMKENLGNIINYMYFLEAIWRD